MLIFCRKGGITEGLIPARCMFLHKGMPDCMASPQILCLQIQHTAESSHLLFLCPKQTVTLNHDFIVIDSRKNSIKYLYQIFDQLCQNYEGKTKFLVYLFQAMTYK